MTRLRHFNRQALGAMLTAWLVLGCRDTQGPGTTSPSLLPALVVSDPAVFAAPLPASASVSHGGSGIAFVSLPSGSIRDGKRIIIAPRTAGTPVAVPLVAGGFDPVAIPATGGDTIDIRVEFDNGTVGQFISVVPVRRGPVVVRTDPPPRRRDVPLNTQLLLVFSEPIDPASITDSTVRLLQGVNPVATQLSYGDSAHLTVVVSPATLVSGADYRLVVTTGVEDLTGDALDSTLVIDFATAPPAPLPVTRLAFTVQPRNVAAGATIRPGVEVSLLDSLGRVVQTATQNVAILVGGRDGWSNSAGGHLTVTTVAGVAVFPDLTIDQPDDHWQLWATAGTLQAFSDTFAVTVAARLEFQTLFSATSSQLGVVRVAVWDTVGHLDSAMIGSITLALGSHPSGASLSGTLSLSPSDGAATFTDLRVDQPGAGYTLVANAPGLPAVESPPFAVRAASAGSGQLAFVRGGQIHLVNADGTGLVRLTGGPDDEDPAWSPDGGRLAFSRGRSGAGGLYFRDLYIMDADGSNLVRRTIGGYALAPSWSPDGASIAFTDMGQGGQDVYVIKAVDDGSGPTSIVSLPGWDAQPAWSPDGTRIAFVTDWLAYDFTSDVFLTTPDGTLRTQVTSGFGFGASLVQYFQPAWSPNGQRIAVVTCHAAFDTCDRSTIAVMKVDGSGMADLANAVGFGRPTWSPDGQTIAFASSGSIGWVSADGSAQGVIITNGQSPAWRP